MVVVSIALVVLAVVLFVVSFAPIDGAVWLYASIACCVAAQGALLTDRLLGRRSRVGARATTTVATAAASPSALPGLAADRSEPSADEGPHVGADAADGSGGPDVDEDLVSTAVVETAAVETETPAEGDVGLTWADVVAEDDATVVETVEASSRDAVVVRPRRRPARPVLGGQGTTAARLERVGAEDVVARREELEPADAERVVRPRRGGPTTTGVTPQEAREAVRRRAAIRRAAAARRAAARGETAGAGPPADARLPRAVHAAAERRGVTRAPASVASSATQPAAVRAARARRAAAARRRAAEAQQDG